MGFETMKPDSAHQLHDFIVKLHQNKKHLKSVRVDSAQKAVLIDLDWAANVGGYSDIRLDVKADRIPDAKEVIAKILAESEQGIEPSSNLSQRLYDCLETQKHR